MFGSYIIDFTDQDKLIRVKIRHLDLDELKIEFLISIQDCDKVESNSSFK